MQEVKYSLPLCLKNTAVAGSLYNNLLSELFTYMPQSIPVSNLKSLLYTSKVYLVNSESIVRPEP